MIKKIRQFRLFKVLGGKRGFTLIEVILGMTISTILLLTLAGIVPAMSLAYVNNIELSYSRMTANNIADAVKNQLTVAQIVELDANHVRYFNEYKDNVINFSDDNPVIPGLSYDERSYMYKTAWVTVGGKPPNLTVTVRVITNAGTGDGQEYTLTREIKQLVS